MRKAIALLLGVAGFGGCSISLAGTLPDSHAHLVRYAVHAHVARDNPGLVALAPTAAATSGTPFQIVPGIDLSAALHAALQVPSQIAEVERIVILCTAVLVIVGLLNAGLLITLLLAKRRETMPEAALVKTAGADSAFSHAAARDAIRAVSEPLAASSHVASHQLVPRDHHLTPPSDVVVRVNNSVEVSEPESVTRACLCGMTISARSRSGRCRRCAQAVRAAAVSARTQRNDDIANRQRHDPAPRFGFAAGTETATI